MKDWVKPFCYLLTIISALILSSGPESEVLQIVLINIIAFCSGFLFRLYLIEKKRQKIVDEILSIKTNTQENINYKYTALGIDHEYVRKFMSDNAHQRLLKVTSGIEFPFLLKPDEQNKVTVGGFKLDLNCFHHSIERE